MKETSNWMSCKYPEYMIDNSKRLSGFLEISRSALLREALSEYLARRLSSLTSSEGEVKHTSKDTKSLNHNNDEQL